MTPVRASERKLGETVRTMPVGTGLAEGLRALPEAGFVVVLVPEDIGVRGNGGRPGAAHLAQAALRRLLEDDARFKVRVIEDPHALDSAMLTNYDAVLLHFQNWQQPGPGAAARDNLQRFVTNGGGLVSVHFACGAWHGEWPEFQNIMGRVWHGQGPGKPQHDKRGKFLVEIADKTHPITAGLTDFETTDELYTCLTGDAPIHLLAHAKSKVDQKYHPQAFSREYGKGRVFLTTLGHDVFAYTNNPVVGELLRRGTAWSAGVSTQPAKQTNSQPHLH